MKEEKSIAPDGEKNNKDNKGEDNSKTLYNVYMSNPHFIMSLASSVCKGRDEEPLENCG